MRRSMGKLEAEAEDIAAGVLRDNGIVAFPICPRLIAHKHEIEIQTRVTHEPGVTGFLMRVGNRFGIYHASHIQNEGFVRFTIAHELGHFFLAGHPEALFPNGDGMHQSRGGYQSKEWFELQADFFASALLMPQGLFVPALTAIRPGFAAIQSLKDLCQTSVLATALRYAKLAQVPVAVVVSRDATIDYCFMSKALLTARGVQWLKKGSNLPARCPTRTFNGKRSNVSGGQMASGWTSLDDWFPGAQQVELKEDVVGLGGYGKTLTVLFADNIGTVPAGTVDAASASK